MGTSYTEEFKNSLISKALLRGDRSFLSISKEAGVAQSTVMGWLKKRDKPLEMKKRTSSIKRSGKEKLKTLIEAGNLSEIELGVYLRREGLYSHNLEEWKSEFISIADSSRKPKHVKDERDQKIKSLKRDLLRKNKALAEASALLILQKKVNLIWGNSDEGEE